MPALILTVLAATLPVAPANPQDGANPARKERTAEPAKKVKELRKERIAVLKKLADQTTTLYQGGRASFDAAYEARLLLLRAELDAAEKESDRITLYENMVNVMKLFEKMAQAKFESARGTEASVLKAKAARLEAEIHLERAKAKEAKASK